MSQPPRRPAGRRATGANGRRATGANGRRATGANGRRATGADVRRRSGTGARRPAAGRRARPRRGGPRLRPTPLAKVVLVVLGLALLGVATLVAARVARPGALPGTTVAGTDVGGMDAAALADAVDAVAARRAVRTLTIERAGAGVVTAAEDVGVDVDVDATVQAVLRRGRQANPLAALRDHARATVGTITVTPVETLDEAMFTTWVRRVGTQLGVEGVRGDVVVIGTQVQILPPPPAETVDVPALRAAVTAALDDPLTTTVQLPTTTAAPTTDPEQLAVLASSAEQAISAPVVLTRGPVSVLFTTDQIASALQVTVPALSGGDGGGDGLVLSVDPVRVGAMVSAEQRSALDRAPVDAGFRVQGATIEVVPATDGFTVDDVVLADQLLRVATSPGPRTAELEGLTEPADLTTADARSLGIVERVAVYTTEHPCCQGRVRNIQRMADLVRGTIVDPGERLSLNALVGRRTVDNGFVDGGAISGGEFVEQIGGGVSQFTTTMFNAIFFAGYQIDEFQPHSYYIPRYPLGREATLNFDPPIDLRFTNDSPHSIYVHTAYTDTSITVALFSTEFAEVTTTTGERYGLRPPPERRETTDELPVGEEEVAASGKDGFSVDFTREIVYVDGRQVVQRFTTTYQPEPRVIRVGTGRPTATPQPTPGGTTPEPTTTATPTPPAQPAPRPTPEDEPPPPPEPAASPGTET